MEIKKIHEGNSLTVQLEGRLDTVTAPELEASLENELDEVTVLVIDLGGLEYMSSAGLRALLLGQKTASSKGGKMTVINVQPVVMQVFNMSGFAKVLNI